jgi:hypothetical protein
VALIEEFLSQVVPVIVADESVPSEYIRLNARAIQQADDESGPRAEPPTVIIGGIPYWKEPGRGANGESAT